MPSNSPTNQIVYIIINMISPYAYEVNNILCLPNGGNYRARFRRQWWPTLKSSDQISYKPGLIVLRDWNSAELIPMRRVNLQSVDLVGDVFYINYVLGELIEFDSDQQVQQDQLRKFNDQMKIEFEPYNNQPKTDLRKLIFLGSDLTTSFADQNAIKEVADREFNNWGKIVERISRVDCFVDVDFLKIIGIVTEGKKKCLWQTTENAFRYLVGNKSYNSLEVFQYAHSPKIGDSSVSRRKIQLSAYSDAVIVVRGNFSITGKYERYELGFKTNSGQRITDTDLILDIVRSDDKGPLASVVIPIRVKTSSLRTSLSAVFVLLFLLGATILFASDQIAQLIPSISQQLAQSIGTLVLILTAPSAKDFVYQMLNRR